MVLSLNFTKKEEDQLLILAKAHSPLVEKFVKSIKATSGHFETEVDTNTAAGTVQVRIELNETPGG